MLINTHPFWTEQLMCEVCFCLKLLHTLECYLYCFHYFLRQSTYMGAQVTRDHNYRVSNGRIVLSEQPPPPTALPYPGKMGVLRILEGGFSTTVFESIVLQDLLAASKANSYWVELLTHLKNLYNTLFLMIPHLNNLKVIINQTTLLLF